jgi:hypothetical protein
MFFRLSAGAVVVALALAPSAASAQAQATTISGFADDRFEPAGAGSAFLTVESLDFRGHLRAAAALVEDWAVHPMVAYNPQAGSSTAVVSQQLISHLDAALMLWNRMRVDLGVPISLVGAGNAATIDTQSYGAPEGHVLGDLRLGADVRVYGKPGSRFVAAAGLQLFVPTGSTGGWNGDGGVRVWPRLMAAGERGRLVWAARAGVQIRPKDSCGCNLAPGSELDGAVAGGWRINPRLLVGPELYASTSFSGGTLAARGTAPVEAMVGGHWAVTPQWNVSLGLARGLTDGTGSPAFRAVAGVQFLMPVAEATAIPAAPPPWNEDPALPALSPVPAASDDAPPAAAQPLGAAEVTP